jgi:hypothetical protein
VFELRIADSGSAILGGGGGDSPRRGGAHSEILKEIRGACRALNNRDDVNESRNGGRFDFAGTASEL